MDPRVAEGSKRIHAVAQHLCFQENKDWRYDPGSTEFDGYFFRARDLLAAADAVSGGEDRLTAAEAHRLIVGVTSMDPNANLDEAEDEWERADAKLRRIASGSPASGGEDQHDDERGVPCACLFDTDRQEEPVVECLYHQRLRTAPAPVVGEDREDRSEAEHVEALWRSAEAQAQEVGDALMQALHDLTVANGNRHRLVAERDRLREALEELRESIVDVHITGPAARMERIREAYIASDAALAGSVSDKDRS